MELYLYYSLHLRSVCKDNFTCNLHHDFYLQKYVHIFNSHKLLNWARSTDACFFKYYASVIYSMYQPQQ